MYIEAMPYVLKREFYYKPFVLSLGYSYVGFELPQAETVHPGCSQLNFDMFRTRFNVTFDNSQIEFSYQCVLKQVARFDNKSIDRAIQAIEQAYSAQTDKDTK